jgi:CBS domain-containing protein
MMENEVGTLVVTESDGVTRAIGIVTDRDIAIRCVGGGLDPDNTPVSRMMTSPVATIEEHTPVDEAVSRMAVTSTRRLVVTGDDGQLVGVLSLDDVIGMITHEAGAVGRLLEKQGPHFAAPGTARR